MLSFAKNEVGVVELLPSMANRHGAITGATGTGKTVTLQRLAEGFSRLGVPVFLADVKGDLSGLCEAGSATEKVAARLTQLKEPVPTWQGCPVTFWDVFGQQGHPVRATVADLGPRLLSRLLSLNDTQEGVLSILFKVADDNGLSLLDLKDLGAMARWVSEHANDVRPLYGNVSPASVGAITRGLLQLQEEGAENFFGEPMLNVDDLLQTQNGRGVINVLAAGALVSRPRVYSTFLLWLLAELFERLPEVGDLEKPKLVFFFDEAHLLFDEAPPALLEKIELVVRLIRSKGVGLYFVTQNPLDIPEKVLGQLGNRVQHALRAFTPRDQKAVAAAAETMRPNPAFDTAQVIGELGIGEALISVLDAQGTPTVTQRAWVLPPVSRIGPIAPEVRARAISESLVAGVYETPIDRESAFERLAARVQQPTPAVAPPAPAPAAPVTTSPTAGALQGLLFGTTGPRGGKKDGLVDVMAKSAARSVGSAVARELTRGILGSLFGGRRR